MYMKKNELTNTANKLVTDYKGLLQWMKVQEHAIKDLPVQVFQSQKKKDASGSASCIAAQCKIQPGSFAG